MVDVETMISCGLQAIILSIYLYGSACCLVESWLQVSPPSFGCIKCQNGPPELWNVPLASHPSTSPSWPFLLFMLHPQTLTQTDDCLKVGTACDMNPATVVIEMNIALIWPYLVPPLVNTRTLRFLCPHNSHPLLECCEKWHLPQYTCWWSSLHSSTYSS